MCCSPYRTVEHEELLEVTGFDCYDCGEPATVMIEGEDKCPTDRGVETRTFYEWVCARCAERYER